MISYRLLVWIEIQALFTVQRVLLICTLESATQMLLFSIVSHTFVYIETYEQLKFPEYSDRKEMNNFGFSMDSSGYRCLFYTQ